MAVLRGIAFLVASVLALQGEALAQSGRVYRVGLVGIGAPDTGILGPEVERDFAQRGYFVGQNLVLERRAAQGKHVEPCNVIRSVTDVRRRVERRTVTSYADGRERFAAVEHAGGEWIRFPFCWLLCGAQKLAAFFCANHI